MIDLEAGYGTVHVEGSAVHTAGERWVNVGNFVLEGREVSADAIVEVLANLILPTEFELEAFVADVTGVDG